MLETVDCAVNVLSISLGRTVPSTGLEQHTPQDRGPVLELLETSRNAQHTHFLKAP